MNSLGRPNEIYFDNYINRINRAMIPALPAYMLFEAVKRYLQMQSVVMPILYIALIVCAASVFITWMFVEGFGLGFAVCLSVIDADHDLNFLLEHATSSKRHTPVQ